MGLIKDDMASFFLFFKFLLLFFGIKREDMKIYICAQGILFHFLFKFTGNRRLCKDRASLSKCTLKAAKPEPLICFK